MQEHIDVASQGLKSKNDGCLHPLAIQQKPYTVVSAGLTDIGLVRQNNEDVWAVMPEIGLYVLADGMGGHQAGEVAARETVNALCRVFKRKLASLKPSNLADVRDFVQKAISYVNARVFKMGRAKSELKGMGTTLCCLLFHSKGLVLAHVGDSRIYRLRGSKFEQLTKDHSLLCDLVDQGQLNEDQVSDFQYKNIITKAVGTEPVVAPTMDMKKVKVGDIFLMCTDGLSDLISSDEMTTILTAAPNLEAAAQKFIHIANEKGGRDNITVLIVKVEPPKETDAKENLPGQ